MHVCLAFKLRVAVGATSVKLHFLIYNDLSEVWSVYLADSSSGIELSFLARYRFLNSHFESLGVVFTDTHSAASKATDLLVALELRWLFAHVVLTWHAQDIKPYTIFNF